ncbi:MAG: family 78 glycoside hydrolase catalytic domain [Clostridia bacterium]|nr:family 78 glycoside hydrolase catalytic domain [Clostridia bacterium]
MKPYDENSVFSGGVYIKAQNEPSPYSLYDPLPIFRRELLCENGIREAEILIQSPGFARVYINGKDITKDLFISPVSDYRRILWYNRYDVRDFLHQGKNTVAVLLGNGFFNESFDSGWHYQTAEWRDAPQFLLCLRINGETALVSDGSWRVNREHSPIIYSHLRSGEYYDARKRDDSVFLCGYDDSDWQFAIERKDAPTGELKEICCQPVREAEEIPPVALTRTAEGYLADFGVTVSGYMEITLRAQRGDEILFRYTEDVDEQLRPKYNQMDRPCFYNESPFHLNKMIASGGTDTFKPLFCYHGFRYVLIEGLRDEAQILDIKAYFTHQDVERRSEFSSGNDVLNYIYRAGIRSSYSNMFWCMTDCPTREKLGWANDAQATAEQLLINFDIVPLFEKWFEDIKSSMREDGSLPGIIPSPDWGFHSGPVCDGLLYELPYKVYVYTGKTDMLTEGIPYFERYADFLQQKAESGHEFWLADWMGHGNSERIPNPFVRDFYLIKAFTVTALARRLAGLSDAAWEEKRTRFAERFMNTYLDEKGFCTVREQSAIAMMLEAGLFREEKPLCEELVQTVLRDGCKLTSGMVGVQYLYSALSRSGRADLAFRLITESEPGFKTWFSHGATTLWESWDGADKGSHNHHMFSCVIAWFYKSLLGICPDPAYPGFEKIELCPHVPGELPFVRGSMQTVRGTLEAEWRADSGRFVYTVKIPEGIRASYRGEALSAGTHIFTVEEETHEDT